MTRGGGLLKWSCLMEMHEWSLLSLVLINSLVCFILIICGVICRSSVPFFSFIFFFFPRMCIVLLRADQTYCPGYAVLLSRKPGAVSCQTVDFSFSNPLRPPQPTETLEGLSLHVIQHIIPNCPLESTSRVVPTLSCVPLVLELVSATVRQSVPPPQCTRGRCLS